MGKVLDYLLGRSEVGRSEITPLEGTNNSILWDVQRFWDETFSGAVLTPATADLIWVANRCMQLNAQQIASMPLKFGSVAPAGGFEPAWVANPDPVWYPNGISDAIFSAIKSLYGWGYALLWITSRYASGTPQAWTVLDPSVVAIDIDEGRRRYKINGDTVDPLSIVQIDRNPGFALHGSSALRSYASQAYGLLAGSDLSRNVLEGGVPRAVLKSQRPINKEQAEKLQAQWVARTTSRAGAPPVLPPELDFEVLSMSPADLLLLDGLQFNARVLASAYGVPPFLLNLPLEGGLTYQNPAMLGEMWWRFELRPTAKRFADAMTAQMLPRGNWVWFDAADTFLPLDQMAEQDDPQLAAPPTAGASPADRPNAVTPIRAVGGSNV